MKTSATDRRITYVRLGEIQEAEINPKEHDLEAVKSSVKKFGYVTPGLVDERTGRLIAGHGRTLVLRGMQTDGEPAPEGVQVADDGEWLVPVIAGWSSRNDAEAAAYLIIDNHHPTLGGWDDHGLSDLLHTIREADEDLLDVVGVDLADLDALLAADDDGDQGAGDDPGPGPARLTEDDDIPAALDGPSIAQRGDLFALGPHRIICGDTTDPAVIGRLLDGLGDVVCIHADPPYGMGKESDGVLNDNLRGAELDAFQEAWWGTWHARWAHNGTAYVWGNALDLWRWWWLSGHGADPDLWLRNEIAWDKGSVPGMRSALEHSFPTATERALVIFRGEQFLGNLNKDAYWSGNDPIREHLCAERDKMGWTAKDINRITGTQMAGHWFGKSQFSIIAGKHYDMLRTEADGKAFGETYDQLFERMFPEARAGANAHRRDMSAAMREARTYFDNSHDSMTDIWTYGRVTGEDRHGHATPKPVAMVERVIMSSTRPGGLVGVPFGGTGPEFIAAHHLGRVAAGAELQTAYVDVICRRFQKHTGITPERIGAGGDREPVDFR